ncbi:MAG TPA: hypothetical protein VGM68_09535 [Rhizomicrobium sp.]
MNETESSWNEVLRVAWLLFWRGLVGGIAIGFVLGLAINLALAYGFHVMLSSNVNAAMGAIVMLIWWPIVVRMALKKRYQGFRLALIRET